MGDVARRMAAENVNAEARAALAAKDAEIERLLDGVKRAHARLQSSTATMGKAGARIIELERRAEAAEAEGARLKLALTKEKEIADGIASAGDRRIKAAEAKIERLKNLNVLQAHLLSDANRRARDERGRCARVAEAQGVLGKAIAAAIRAGT